MSRLYISIVALCSYVLVNIPRACLATSASRAFASSEDDIWLGTTATINARLLAFVDFNNDRYSDALFASPDSKSIEVHLWKPYDFQPQHTYTTDAPGEFSQFQTVSIPNDFIVRTGAAADFNKDGLPDVMVYVNKDDTSMTLIFLQQDGRLDEANPINISSPDSEPSIIDFNGDLVPDLVFADGTGFAVRHLDQHGAVQTLESGNLQGPLASNNSITFIDVNGDCRPDFVIPRDGGDDVTYLDFYLATDSADSFNRGLDGAAKSLEFKYSIGYLSFADVQGTGTPDLIVPQQAQEKPARIHIFPNKQSAPPRDNLCQGSSSWLEVDTSDAEAGPNHFVVERLDGRNEFRHGSIRVRANDINRDSRSELLIPLENGGFDVYVLGDQYQAHEISGSLGNLHTLEGIKDAAFFDLGDDGVYDMMTVFDDKTVVLRNTYEQDAFFLKTIALDGFPRDTDQKAYGCISFGATTKFRVEELNGNSVIRSCYQLTQTASNALQAPYCMVGFGHEQRNSYVRSFWMGLFVTNNGEGHYWEWKGIIPNSQLIMFPLEKIPSRWKLELWLDQKRGLLWVGVTVLSTLLVLAITIYVLHRRQRAQERKEMASHSHLPFL